MTFTTDSVRGNTHELTVFPDRRIQSISLVALIDLPSPVVGPVNPGEYISSKPYFSYSGLYI